MIDPTIKFTFNEWMGIVKPKEFEFKDGTTHMCSFEQKINMALVKKFFINDIFKNLLHL